MFRIIIALCTFSLIISCSKEEAVNPCENIICLNGGFCANGLCNCPDGYEGSDCSIQSTPSRMILKKVIVTKFPPTEDNGAGWDILDGPDIIFSLLIGQNEVYRSSVFFEDAIQGQNYTFDNLNIVITEPTSNYTLNLFDYDDGLTADDFMGGVIFPFYSSTNVNFPSTIIIDSNNLNTGWILEVEYEF